MDTLRLLTDRIIPACAGKRLKSPLRRGVGADHPRLRGEKIRKRHKEESMRGSSPLARGKGGRCNPLGRPLGIIPACAGKSVQ